MPLVAYKNEHVSRPRSEAPNLATVTVNARYAQLPALGFREAFTDLLDADDVTLALALRTGDSRAPRAAWIRFAPAVYRVLRRTFGPGRDIEDMQQDIFLAFFRKVSGLREPGALKGFLMAITSRTIKYQIRCARLSRVIHFMEPVDCPGGVDAHWVEGPDHDTIQTLTVFYSVLDRLNARDRTLFGLRFLEGTELKEVALTLGISLSTAKRHSARIWKWVARRIRNEPALASDHRR